MQHISKFLMAAFALGCAAHAAAADRVWHPYSEVCEKLQLVKFFDVPEVERSQLQVLFKTPTLAPDGQPVVLTINAASRPMRVAADAKGLMNIPFDRQLLAENPDVLVNLPAGQALTLSLDLRPTLPRQLRLDYVEFMSAVPQANAMIRKQAGLMRLLAPKMRKLVLKYDRPDAQVVSIGDGTSATTFRVGPSGEIVVPFDDARLAANPRIRISDMPQGMDLAE